LHVTTRSAEWHPGLAVLKDDGRARGEARALAGCNGAGVALDCPGLGAARRHHHTKARYHWRVHAAVTRRGGKDIALAVHGTDIARVQRLSAGRLWYGLQTAPGNHGTIAVPGIARWRHPRVRLVRLNQLPPRLDVLLRQQPLHRHIDELGVAVVA